MFMITLSTIYHLKKPTKQTQASKKKKKSKNKECCETDTTIVRFQINSVSL